MNCSYIKTGANKMSEQVITVNKPSRVQGMEIILLVSGVLNILGGLGFICGALVSIVGVICLPVVALPLILGVYEVVYASKLMNHKQVNANDLKTIAILEIATIIYGNAISLVAGILNLVFLDDQPVKEYLA